MTTNLRYPIVPHVNRQRDAIPWSGVANWGNQRNPNIECIAYVAGDGVTGFTCHTHPMSFGQTATKAVVRFVFDVNAGQQGQIRLTSFYYDINNVMKWKNDWHTPFISNRPYHPDNQGADITAAFNAYMATAPADFGHDLQFTCDVIGYGYLYGAWLELEK